MTELPDPPPGRAGSALEEAPRRRRPSALVAVSLVAAGWALLYALYRGYYGLGGTVGMFGTPTSWTQWRQINLVAAAILLVAAALPVAALPLWQRPQARPVLLAVCWVVAVGCTMHGLIDDVERVLSLSGRLRIDYPFFATVNRRAADLQDLAFNETWFLIEGILWGVLAWISLGRSPSRRRWVGTAVVAIAALSSMGLLSAFGVVGKFIVA